MNAVIYLRVSTQDQDHTRQNRELLEYAKYKRLKILATFDEKVSGLKNGADRVQFAAMQAFLAKNKVDTILVWELSRFGRKMIDVINNIENFSNAGINIYFKKENINTLDSNGKRDTTTSILISVLSGFSEMEKQTFRARSISGIRHNVANGGAGTGLIKAYGYKSVDKKLVIDETEAKVVTMIYKKYLSGLGVTQLASHLNNLEIPTRFNLAYKNKTVKSKYGYEKKGENFVWRDGTVYAILTNTIYKGERKHKGEVFPVPAIIDAQTFKRVQKRLKSKFNKRTVGIKHSNILLGLCKCGNCGKNYYLHERTPKNGKGARDKAYKCISNRYAGESCGNPSISKDKLLTALHIVSQPIIMHETIGDKIKSQDNVRSLFDNKQIQIDSIQKEVNEINDSLNDLIKMKLKKQINSKQFAEFKTGIDKNLSKKEEILSRLSNELEKMNKVYKFSKQFIPEYTMQVFKDFFHHYVESVKIFEVRNKKILQYFTTGGEAVILVEVKPTLSDKVVHFVISRRSNNLMFIAMNNPEKESTRQIETNGYRIARRVKKPFVTMNKILDFSL